VEGTFVPVGVGRIQGIDPHSAVGVFGANRTLFQRGAVASFDHVPISTVRQSTDGFACSGGLGCLDSDIDQSFPEVKCCKGTAHKRRASEASLHCTNLKRPVACAVSFAVTPVTMRLNRTAIEGSSTLRICSVRTDCTGLNVTSAGGLVAIRSWITNGTDDLANPIVGAKIINPAVV